MERNHILFARIHAVESRSQIVESVVISDHHQNASAAHSERPRGQVVTSFYIELIELSSCPGASASNFFRYLEDGKKYDRERDAGNRRNLFCKEINNAQRGQRNRDQRETNRNLGFTDPKIQGHTILTL